MPDRVPYARAALGLLPLPGRRTGLPETELTLPAVPIDRDRLASYARVCGFRLRDDLPPTFIHVLAFPLAMRLMSALDFPFPVIGLVHIANRIDVLAPVDSGSRLDLAVRSADLRPHERGHQFDVITEATVDSELVWRGVSTYLRKGAEGTGSSGSPAKDRGEAPTPSAIWKVPARVGPDYAEVSGDRNPIHTSWLGARLFGFRRPIAHGMWSKARCLAALEGRLPDRFTVDAQFKLPILLPATIAFAAAPCERFSLHDARTGRPHLVGTLTTPASSV